MRGGAFVSLGRLIELALEDLLIEACYLDDDYLVVVLGGTCFSFSYPDARTFLIGVLRGRSWYCDRQPEQLPTRVRLTEQPWPQEATLDDLLSYANMLGLIEDYTRHPAVGSVTIRSATFTCTMTYAEAIDFLADGIQEELLRINRTSGEVAVRALYASGRRAIVPEAPRALRRQPGMPDRAPERG